MYASKPKIPVKARLLTSKLDAAPGEFVTIVPPDMAELGEIFWVWLAAIILKAA
jgi:hypothetical protein